MRMLLEILGSEFQVLEDGQIRKGCYALSNYKTLHLCETIFVFSYLLNHQLAGATLQLLKWLTTPNLSLITNEHSAPLKKLDTRVGKQMLYFLQEKVSYKISKRTREIASSNWGKKCRLAKSSSLKLCVLGASLTHNTKIFSSNRMTKSKFLLGFNPYHVRFQLCYFFRRFRTQIIYSDDVVCASCCNKHATLKKKTSEEKEMESYL